MVTRKMHGNVSELNCAMILFWCCPTGFTGAAPSWQNFWLLIVVFFSIFSSGIVTQTWWKLWIGKRSTLVRFVPLCQEASCPIWCKTWASSGAVWGSAAKIIHSSAQDRIRNSVDPDRHTKESRVWQILVSSWNTTGLLKCLEIDAF